MTTHSWFRSVAGAGLTVICGLFLWKTSVSEGWVNASYDYLFRFGGRAVSNNVVLILMDNEAYDHCQQVRGQPWDRALHARYYCQRRICRLGAEDELRGLHHAPEMNFRGLSRFCSRKRWRRRRLPNTGAVWNSALISIGDTAWNAAENFFGALRS